MEQASIRPTAGTYSSSAPSPQGRSRWRSITRGPHTDPAWARPAQIVLLLATLAFYTYNLTASGWANSFYSAAVQAGSQSWEAFFFGSSDAANSITVDKTPASLWVMALSVRLLGLNSFAILFPQALMGVGTVAILYSTVKRYFGAAAGLLAGLVMAVTPVAVLMFRFNNPDALLVLLMTAAAALTLRACQAGSGRLMVLVGVLLGFGFLTKMLQVLLVVPALGLVYLVCADTTLRKRILHSLAALLGLVAAAGWWVAIVELVPASMRPYIGGSQNNSILELTLGYNGLGRLNGSEAGSVGGGNGWGSTGIGRMFSASIGGQISWLIPTALLLLIVSLVLGARLPRTDLRRASYLAWGGWLLVTGLTFSFMAGIFHEYYTVALAPAIAALVGMGLAEAWGRRHALVGSLTMSASLGLAVAWSYVLLARTTEYPAALRWTVLVGGLAVAFGLLFAGRLRGRVLGALVAVAVVLGLAGPTAYSLTTVNSAHTGSIVTAGPNTGGGPGGAGGPGGGFGRGAGGPGGLGTGRGAAGGPGVGNTLPGNSWPGNSWPGNSWPSNTRPGTGGAIGGGGTTSGPSAGGIGARGGMGGLLNASTPSAKAVATVSANAGSYTWVAAAVGSQNAAGMQLATQLPVMAVGGFNGTDPSPTLEEFQVLVNQGKIHYFIGGSGMGGNSPGGSNSSAQIAAWVADNFTAVNVGGTTLYDLTQSAPAQATTGNGITS